MESSAAAADQWHRGVCVCVCVRARARGTHHLTPNILFYQM